MMFKKEKRSNQDIRGIVNNLIEISKIDTVYKKVYVQRARRVFSEIFPYDIYHQLIQESAYLSQLTRKISISIEKNDWGPLAVTST